MSGMAVRSVIATVIFAGALAGRTLAAIASAVQTPAPPAANAVVYTDEQAARGAETFSGVCVECHARKDFSDAEFRGKWRGRTAFDLFDRIRSTMPESNPGSLARGAYLDIVAYIAKLNTMSAGTAALPDDDEALKKLILALPSEPGRR